MSVVADGVSFSERYGRWAMVLGASEGVGACAADELAGRGLDVVLVARNGPLLDEIAAGIRDRHGVEVRTLVLDLAEPGAAKQIISFVDDLAVGLLIYTVGAIHNSQLFLDQRFELTERMITLNCSVPATLVHALAPAMKQRGRGGIVLVGSTGCYAGGPHMVSYSAAKAYQVNLAEGLWAELDPHGIDVCIAVIGSTNTPARTRTLGVDYDESQDMTSEDVAHEMIENIANGPVRVIARSDVGIGLLNEPWSEFRRTAVSTLLESMKGFTARTTKPGV
jgi:short-subunit dehydrogenase